MYASCKRVFSMLPLAARIAGNTLVLHGGLFRKPPPPEPKKHRRKRNKWLSFGALCSTLSSDLALAFER